MRWLNGGKGDWFVSCEMVDVFVIRLSQAEATTQQQVDHLPSLSRKKDRWFMIWLVLSSCCENLCDDDDMISPKALVVKW